ncbi:MAG: CHAT domain-containing protein, partial [Caldilineaceae bacterium]|nr:CHAT domain-containing protein [Caldilineaceae bacterium]
MPSPVYPTPFVIRPAADFITANPALRRNSQNLARDYANRRLVTDEALQAIGRGLWQALACDADFTQAAQQAGAQTLPIVIESRDPAVQMLPWETLYHPEHGFLGKANGFTLLRRTTEPLASPPPVQKGPLRVLIFTALPDDVDAERARLNVEEEQSQLLEALTPWLAQGRVELTMPDDGRFETLQELLRSRQPHLLFLSGHGKFVAPPAADQPPYGLFLFEDEWGASNPVDER